MENFLIFRNRPNAKNIDTYIEQWKSCSTLTGLNANWSYQGYRDAREYVDLFDNDLERLNMINDYDCISILV